jgi:hypothetical protein
VREGRDGDLHDIVHIERGALIVLPVQLPQLHANMRITGSAN